MGSFERNARAFLKVTVDEESLVPDGDKYPADAAVALLALVGLKTLDDVPPEYLQASSALVADGVWGEHGERSLQFLRDLYSDDSEDESEEPDADADEEA